MQGPVQQGCQQCPPAMGMHPQGVGVQGMQMPSLPQRGMVQLGPMPAACCVSQMPNGCVSMSGQQTVESTVRQMQEMISRLTPMQAQAVQTGLEGKRAGCPNPLRPRSACEHICAGCPVEQFPSAWE